MSRRSNPAAPFRVAVWGPGGIGQPLIRECINKPEIDLVGVLCFSDDKDGKDAGEYFGYGTAGVRMTKDKDAILALKPDVILHSTQVSSAVDIDSEVTNDLVRMLESGINVASSVAYFWLPVQGAAFLEKIEAACRKGGSVLHSSGINPGLLNERWAVALTGVCTSIDSIRVQEISNNTTIPSLDMLVRGIGMGRTIEDVTREKKYSVGSRYYHESVTLACHLLGKQVERVDYELTWVLGREDSEYPIRQVDGTTKTLKIPKGTIAGKYDRYVGYVDGKPFYTLEEIFFLDERDTQGVKMNGRPYVGTIRIEGSPTSVEAEIGLMASVLENKTLREDGTRPTYNTTAVTLIQAIPLVCGAEPGILYPSTFAHYYPDLREFPSPLIEASLEAIPAH
jgi:2,4-diaminopentanoate dehydrogenase